MYSELLGLTEEEACRELQKSALPYRIVYAEDKKTVGNDKIVIAVKTVDEKTVLIIGRFKTDVTKE